MEKIVIITNGNYFASIILSKTIRKYYRQIAEVFVITGDYKGRNGIKAAIELMKVTALPYFFCKIMQHILFHLANWANPQKLTSVEMLARKFNIPVCSYKSVKSDILINKISSYAPDLIVSVSCPQMIGKKILSTARLGGINIHSSLLPKYAGLAPYFWVLSENERITGTTVHYMTLRFDEGNILVQKLVEITPGESSFGLFYKLSDVGSEALLEAIPKVFNGDKGQQQDLRQLTYFSSPTMAGYKKLKQNGFSLMYIKEVSRFISNNNSL